MTFSSDWLAPRAGEFALPTDLAGAVATLRDAEQELAAFRQSLGTAVQPLADGQHGGTATQADAERPTPGP